ncbi:hypothetical protein RN001_011200 [Aquatica leii]|uniref:Secreted protein n=1 Tax=Aquatica leii TaxID=1421715 RepID=A0AAN7P7Q7_9COLE|nr:hypothetical protein RN001_011200 [Aquatica leii]
MKITFVLIVFIAKVLCKENGTTPHKTVPVLFLQPNLEQILRPLSDAVTNVWTQLHHPNNGLSNFLKPAYLWEKLVEFKQALVSNPNAAIYGFGQNGNHDYPFPYRFNNEKN